jgi:hypothetical protein
MGALPRGRGFDQDARYATMGSISGALQYQLAGAVRRIKHRHVPDVRQLECGPGLVTLAVRECLIESRLWKFFECARAYEACIGPRHKADILEALPLDQVDDVGDVGFQIDVLAQQMRALG